MGRLRLCLIRLLAVLFGAVLAAGAWSDSRDLDFDLQPLFEAKGNPMHVTPYLVTVGNRGPDARGNVVVQGQGFAMRYPIELPRGTQKRLIIYPTEPMYRMSPTSYVLETNQGNLRLQRGINYEAQTWYALAISDTSGVASFLQQGGEYQKAMIDAYGRPGRLPDRAVGYLGCRLVLLGDGAERMSDPEVRALQDYVLMGGNVVMLGGASTPLLNDPRWASWVPIRPERPKTLTAKGAAKMGLEPKGTFTLTPGTPVAGAKLLSSYQDEVLAVEKAVGLGRVVYLSVNAFEEPARYWAGWQPFFRALSLTEGGHEFAKQLGLTNTDGYNSTLPAMYSMSSNGPTVPGDPFQAQMPATGTILAILLIYFILVVPVNLLLLRKMGRGELAWITSPIISVVFAGIFFRFAAGLYSADLSTATRGLWVVDEAAESGQFLGSTQMFFPRGGAYDLGLEGVEHIVSRRVSDYGADDDRLFNDLRAIDDGRIRVPGMQVRNLSFHEFGFQQRMPGGQMFELSADGMSVTNRSNLTLSNARLLLDGKAYKLDDLKPGATVRRGAAAELWMDWQTMMNMTKNSPRFAVTGELPASVRPGPQVGRIVPTYHSIQLMAFGARKGGR